MTNELATTQQTALAPAPYSADRNPALVYLASLAESSRRPQRQSLTAIAQTVDAGATFDAFPWANLRYQHTQAIRAKLAATYSASTANRHLSALRGVLKECWRLGYMGAEEYQRAIDLRPLRARKQTRPRRGAT